MVIKIHRTFHNVSIQIIQTYWIDIKKTIDLVLWFFNVQIVQTIFFQHSIKHTMIFEIIIGKKGKNRK